jgi:hypothetical protein
MDASKPDVWLATKADKGVTLSACQSHSDVDAAWDDYLQSAANGQFQQSSIWGKLKIGDGWRVTRVVIRDRDSIRGGFQLLIRRRGLLREAFLNKGPLLCEMGAAFDVWLFELIRLTLKRQRIHLLLVQPPDADVHCCDLLAKNGFMPSVLGQLVTASFHIPIGRGLPEYETRMRRSLRLEARQAKKRGLVVREGRDTDIPVFFRLMSASAERQGSRPNPASAAALLSLWQGFHERHLCRVTIAEDQNRPIAGLLTIRFGERVTQWKKGWTGEARDKHPNTLLAVESIEWAQATGATLVDFAGGGRPFAAALLKGEDPTEEQRRSRDFYLLGLGAHPVLLPLPRVCFPNRLLRFAYHTLVTTVWRNRHQSR